MSLVEYARRELERIGEDPEMTDHLVGVVAKFAEFGHSGGSASIAIPRLCKLLRQEPLSPITSDPDEWEDRSEISSSPLWQNKRDSRAFSEDGGKTWRLVGEEDQVPSEEKRPAAAALVEIVELDHATDDTTPGSIIVPDEIRINGVPLLVPEGQSIRVHEMAFGKTPAGVRAEDAVLVTVTLFARRVVIAAEDDLPPFNKGVALPSGVSEGRTDQPEPVVGDG